MTVSTPTKTKLGRKRFNEEALMANRLTIRFDPSDYAALLEYCNQVGKKPSVVVRALVLKEVYDLSEISK